MSLEYAVLLLTLLIDVTSAIICVLIGRTNRKMQSIKTVVLAEIADMKYMIKLLRNRLDSPSKDENTC